MKKKTEKIKKTKES